VIAAVWDKIMRPAPPRPLRSGGWQQRDSPHPINGLARRREISGGRCKLTRGGSRPALAAATCRLHLPGRTGEGSV